jgi:UDP-N-acetylmuramoyl-L-alanyl-D-glutamate--2,6-diaminopimelate ligase
MKLSELLRSVPFQFRLTGPDAEISGVASDSRQVQPGDLFVAVAGENVDGHRYIPAALENGAAAVLGTQSAPALKVPYIQVADSRAALPHIAAAFHGFPAHKMTILGVTGTDGKTTTTNMIFQILQAAGIKAGMISTINAVFGNQVLDTGFHVTTPDAPDIQRYLSRMLADGVTHVVLEVTSHGLAQQRVEACEFDLAVITNITHEHLDYHGSFEAYRAAKAQLVSGLQSTVEKQQGNPRLAVLNRDDDSYAYLSRIATTRMISYGFHPDADVQPQQVERSLDGMSFMVSGMGSRFPITCPLMGDFNISNCLAAVSATVFGLGISPQAARQGIAQVNLVPGRMERIDLGQDFTAMVDFAHTPNALEKALEAVRPLAAGRVITVFGSAGLRDRQKRRMMAQVSVRLADLTVLTAEDPRTELLDDILAQMAGGATAQGGVEGQTFWRIPDRGEAIKFALAQARPGDVVLACGKGHEQSMCFGQVEYPWDDRTAMRAALAERLGIPGPEMPYLPTQDHENS